MSQRMRIFVCKILQRRVYDLFSNKQSVLLCFAFFSMTLIAVLHIFEICLIWSHKIEIKASIKAREDCHSCHDFPIDVVYTWVNGSDPKLLAELFKTRQEIQNSISAKLEKQTNNDCTEEVNQQKESEYSIDCNDCMEAPIVFMSPPVNNPNKIFNNVTKFEILDSRGTLIYFSSIAKARELTMRCFLSYNTTTYSLRKTHIILGSQPVSEAPNGNTNRKKSEIQLKISSLILLYGIPVNTSTHSKLLRYLSPFARKQVNIINIYDEKRIALFALKNPIVNVTKVIQALRMTLVKFETTGQSIKILHPIDLLVSGSHVSATEEMVNTSEDMSESRFADNQELRYSLRSLEKNAAWVRYVYIVTNGQIPNWLNLENPRVKIITHEEIFANKSHLPSFSSPAIETHLHRIPNLSKRFIYLNDDILFGKPIFPDDFYTRSKGYKVYLSWPVPNCAVGCPINWLKDGYCDQACNSSECLWDGGDCASDQLNSDNPLNLRPFHNTYANISMAKQYSDGFCSANCVDSWLADKFCDQVCNNMDCGFDLGDCGTNNFNLLESIEFKPKRKVYSYRSDANAIYFNLTKFVSTNFDNKVEISEITYENNSFVRSSAMNMNHKTLIFLFFRNQQKANLNITLKGLKNNSDFIIRFQALVSNDSKLNTSYASIGKNSTQVEEEYEDIGAKEENHLIEETSYLYEDIGNKTYEKSTKIESKFSNRNQYPVYPKILTTTETQFNTSFECEFNITELPNDIKQKFNDLEEKFKNGILTEKGLKNFKQRLIQLYIKQLCNYETTVKTYDNTISAFDWEKRSTFADIENSIHSEEGLDLRRGGQRVLIRHLMDTYADSLRYVNHLYNKVFGIEIRKVPAHMAHFIDVDIMSRLQNRFSNHFDITSSHRIRSSDDMQFAFAYNYYLMSELKKVNLSDVFNEFDVDSSGTWSYSEVRTVMINIYELPLKLETVDEFYRILFSCCNTGDNMCTQVKDNLNISHYYYRGLEKGVKQSIEFPKRAVVECENVTNLLYKIHEKDKENRFEIIGEEEVSFKMIRSNATLVAKELDELNKHMKKFMCLNDNIEHKNSAIDVIRVKQMLEEFYESIFPIQSQFELPFGQTNRFAYIEQYKQWKDKQKPDFRYKSNILWICLTLFGLVLVFISKRIDLISRMTKNRAKHTMSEGYNRDL